MGETMKPCPFCGGRVELLERQEGKLLVFKCEDASPCIGSGLGQYVKPENREAAIEAWNRRASPPDAGVVTDAMHHLGSVLVMLAELHADDRTDAFEAALAFHTQHNPDRQVQPEPAYETRLVHTGPMERAIAATAPDETGLREALGEMQAALKPFAEQADEYDAFGGDPAADDDQTDWPSFQVADFRRARAALTGSD